MSQDLESKTNEQLKDIIRKYNLTHHIRGYSKMKKVDLISSIRKHMKPVEQNINIEKKEENINIIKQNKPEPKEETIPINDKQKFRKFLYNKYNDTLDEFNENNINNKETLEKKQRLLKKLIDEFEKEIIPKYNLHYANQGKVKINTIEGDIIKYLRKYRDRLKLLFNKLKNFKLEKKEKEKEEFEIGDYVYIMRGKNKLESGAIYKINDDTGEVELIKVGWYEDKQYYPNGGLERIKYKRYNLNPLSKTNIIKTTINNIHSKPEKRDTDYGA